MADIKHYLQIKKDHENKNAKNANSKTSSNVVKGVFFNTNQKDTDIDDEDYHTKIRRHRTKLAVYVGIGIIAFIILGVIVSVAFSNIKYTGYTIIKSINKEDSASANYIDYNDGYIRYSNDGISYFSKDGNVIWNQTYQMKNPQLKICGKSVAVGDLNGTSIYIFDDNGILGNIDTSLPIEQIEVSKQGLVDAVLEDNNANYIKLYNSKGDVLVTSKTVLNKDGYPLDISTSDDATKLIVSNLNVNGNSIENKVAFYSFSDVGQNHTDNIVGIFNQYGNTLVPEVKFLNDTCAVAVGENILSIYNIKEIPSLAKEITLDSPIDRVFMSDEYIGLVLKNNDSANLYKLVVYNLKGNMVMHSTFNTEYNTIKFDGKSIIMYNDTTFTLMNLNGKVQFEQNFDLPIKSVLSLGSKGNYVLISSKYIQEIKLK